MTKKPALEVEIYGAWILSEDGFDFACPVLAEDLGKIKETFGADNVTVCGGTLIIH